MKKIDKSKWNLHNNEWATPTDLYNYFLSLGFIDPCPFGGDDIAYFNYDYFNNFLYINPPFDQKKEFVNWILNLDKSNKIILLLPLQASKVYTNLYNNCFSFILNERLKFNDSKHAPFDCVMFFINFNLCGCKCGSVSAFKNFLNDILEVSCYEKN